MEMFVLDKSSYITAFKVDARLLSTTLYHLPPQRTRQCCHPRIGLLKLKSPRASENRDSVGQDHDRKPLGRSDSLLVLCHF